MSLTQFLADQLFRAVGITRRHPVVVFDTLSFGDRRVLKKEGVIFGPPEHPIRGGVYRKVLLPEGWKIKPSIGGRYLRDHYGNKRAFVSDVRRRMSITK